MADDQGELSAAEVQAVLDGIDAAFEQVLHGRFGGGIELAILRNADEESVQVLRMPGSGMEDRVRLLLRRQGALHGPATGRGHMIGIVTLAAPPAKAVGDVAVQTEILDSRDVNEAADASYLNSGVVFSDGSGPGSAGLTVVRSSEAAAQAGQRGARDKRGWLPQQSRNNPSRSLGLGSNGHRRSPVSGFVLPVSCELLQRIGGAIAAIGIGGTERPVGAVALVIETSGSTMP